MEQLRPARPHPDVVGDILPEPGLVIARCAVRSCGAVTALDIGADLHNLMRRASITRLEDQLRCTCGARRGALEAWPANLSPMPGRTRLYLFLA